MESNVKVLEPEQTVRPRFGQRFLNDDDDIFEYNSWDDVEWDEEQERNAREVVARNGVVNFTPEELHDFERSARFFWDMFYAVHTNRFFKNRHWLFTEFPELKDETNKTLFEIGCGVGNTIFPILENCKKRDDFFIYASDFSTTALDILRENPMYDEKKCKLFSLDATSEKWVTPIPENSVDIAVMIFVLSAIDPKKSATVAKQLYRFMKPGGVVLFRDYGRYDMAQLRFKVGRCIGQNFYARADGTRVYFFLKDEVTSIFQSAGFEEVEIREDRRLQVNRSKLLEMHRVWIQAKFKKPE